MPRHRGQSRSKKMHPRTSKRKQCAATSHTALFIAVTRTQGSKPVVDLPALGWRRAADVPALGWRPIVDLPALGSKTVVDLPALGSRPVADLPGLGWRPIFDLSAVLQRHTYEKHKFFMFVDSHRTTPHTEPFLYISRHEFEGSTARVWTSENLLFLLNLWCVNFHVNFL